MVIVLANFSITERDFTNPAHSDTTGVVLYGRLRVVDPGRFMGGSANGLLEGCNQRILVSEPRLDHALKRLPFPLLGRALRVECSATGLRCSPAPTAFCRYALIGRC